MPHLTIDALPLLGIGGISNYITPFARELSRQAAPAFQTELLFRTGCSRKRKNAVARLAAAGLPEHASARLLPFPDAMLRLLWEHGMFTLPGKERADDLFLATTEMVPRCKKAAVGACVYDIVPLMIPQKFSLDLERYALTVFTLLRKTDFVIAISQATKKDIVERFKYPEHRIVVVYPGVTPPQPAPRAPAPRRPFILYMGALAPNKNVDGLIRVFARCVNEHGQDIDLVLTGRDFCGQPFWDETIRPLHIADRVRFAGWVADAERDSLLAGAAMLWQFSWYEGFGLPVLEAAAAGIPVLCSNRGSLPEILRNPEQEIDPDDEAGAAVKAAKALASPQTLEAWKQQGLKRAAVFNWKQSVEGFLQWYTRLSRGKY
ncbi:MAG: glycosyltransferase family 4 protein [Chitinispirillaceae bacterium]|nr:glycosyltransferase family 4 protein [Chitinispirillaceae bacterium]